jgi:molybdate transport system substrate-binding protein
MKRVLAVILGGCLAVSAWAEQPIQIAVASNFYAPLKAISAEFKRQTGIPVRLSTGATGMLAAQIQRGAPYDLFFAADAKRPQWLERQGLTEPNSRFVYALGTLVVWSPRAERLSPNLTKLDADHPQLRHFAVANPKTAPYGRAGQQALQKLQLWQPLKERQKLVFGENIGKTYQYVATGHAQMGLVALAEVINRPQNQVWRVPANLYDPIVQEAVVLKGHLRPAVQKFLRFFHQPAVQQKIQTSGYRLPKRK